MGLNSHVEIAKHCYSMPDQLLRQVLERKRSKAIYDSIGLATPRTIELDKINVAPCYRADEGR